MIHEPSTWTQTLDQSLGFRFQCLRAAWAGGSQPLNHRPPTLQPLLQLIGGGDDQILMQDPKHKRGKSKEMVKSD